MWPLDAKRTARAIGRADEGLDIAALWLKIRLFACHLALRLILERWPAASYSRAKVETMFLGKL
jgi:hypothetical protein